MLDPGPFVSIQICVLKPVLSLQAPVFVLFDKNVSSGHNPFLCCSKRRLFKPALSPTSPIFTELPIASATSPTFISIGHFDWTCKNKTWHVVVNATTRAVPPRQKGRCQLRRGFLWGDYATTSPRRSAPITPSYMQDSGHHAAPPRYAA